MQIQSIGDRIKQLRISIGMTQTNLARRLEVTEKSIQRYESSKSRPDTYTLAKIAIFFDVSSDYLLGINSIEEQISEVKNKIIGEGGYNHLYKCYLDSKNDYVIDDTSEYYWIEASGEEIGGQTKWVGWTDGIPREEIRVLREIIPDKAIMACTEIYGKPMVLNTEEDVMVFLIFGGQAIVRKDICEKHLPWFLKPFIL